MGWLDDLRRFLEAGETTEPGGAPPVPPPTFTVGPRPFGVGRDVAGVEWQTAERTSGLVRYRASAGDAWIEVVDDSRQRDHQRTLSPLTPDTEYQVEVVAVVPRRGATPAMQALSLKTLGAPPPPREDEDEGEEQGGQGGTESGTEVEPIPHAAATLNVLAEKAVWTPGSLTEVDPGFQAWLKAYCLGGPTKLVVADMKEVPGRMRKAGFRGRDTALWWTMSRSYAGWNWTFHGHDPDDHLSNQRRELRDFWSNYIEVVKSVMTAAPRTTAVILENDEVGRCGKTLGNYTERQLNAVRSRVEMGHFVAD